MFGPPNAHVTHTTYEFRRLDQTLEEIGASMGCLDAYLFTLLDTRASFVIASPLGDRPLVYASDGFCVMSGYERDEILGRNCRFLQGPETDPEHVAKIRAGVEKSESVAVRLLNYKKNGTPFWNTLHITPKFSAEGTLEFFLGVQLHAIERNDTSAQLVPETKPPEPADTLDERSDGSGSPDLGASPPDPTPGESKTGAAERRSLIRVTNPLEEQLILWMSVCNENWRLYWQLGYELRKKDAWLFIPALILLAFTSVFATTQATESVLRSDDDSPHVWFRYVEPYLVMVGSIVATVLTGVANYRRFGERSDRCKNAAKGFGKIAMRINVSLNFFKMNSRDPCADARLQTFAREIMNQIDNVVQDAPDLPPERMKDLNRISPSGNLVGPDPRLRFQYAEPMQRPVHRTGSERSLKQKVQRWVRRTMGNDATPTGPAAV